MSRHVQMKVVSTIWEWSFPVFWCQKAINQTPVQAQFWGWWSQPAPTSSCWTDSKFPYKWAAWSWEEKLRREKEKKKSELNQWRQFRIEQRHFNKLLPYLLLFKTILGISTSYQFPLTLQGIVLGACRTRSPLGKFRSWEAEENTDPWTFTFLYFCVHTPWPTCPSAAFLSSDARHLGSGSGGHLFDYDQWTIPGLKISLLGWVSMVASACSSVEITPTNFPPHWGPKEKKT